MERPQNLAAFLSKIAEKSEAANTDTVNKIKEKLEKEAQERIEHKIMEVYRMIEQKVATLRQYRKEEEKLKVAIKELEKKAELILSGKDDA